VEADSYVSIEECKFVHWKVKTIECCKLRVLFHDLIVRARILLVGRLVHFDQKPSSKNLMMNDKCHNYTAKKLGISLLWAVTKYNFRVAIHLIKENATESYKITSAQSA
jgi:hypothetical protein